MIATSVVGVAVSGYLLLTNRPIEVRIARIETNVPVRVFGLGTVEARVLSKIGFEVDGAIVDLQADHGDMVKQGSVLARLSTAKQEARAAKARTGVLSAEVGVRRAEANVVKSRAVLAQRLEANKRKKALVRRDVVSEQAAEEAQRDEDVATSEVEVAEADLETARSELALETASLGQHALTAPYDGIVIERHKELGTVVRAGEPVFTVIANDSYWGLAYVDEARSGYIVEGQKVEARLRSRPLDVFTGQVARVGLESDRVSEERRVYIKGDKPPSRVHLGEQAEFWITVAHLDKVLLVPEAAVQGFDGRQGIVWTLRGGRLERQTVSFRHRTEDARLEIAGGLRPDTEVVVLLDAGLREGRRASAITEAGP